MGHHGWGNPPALYSPWREPGVRALRIARSAHLPTRVSVPYTQRLLRRAGGAGGWQEGHRLELKDPEDPDSPLVFAGVVFNEMKGAMSSADSQFTRKLSAEVYPTSTYHHNSGGDPKNIPELTHKQLVLRVCRCDSHNELHPAACVSVQMPSTVLSIE